MVENDKQFYKLEFVDTFTPLSLVSLDSSPSRVEPNIAFPLRGEGVTAGDGRGDLFIPTNSNMQQKKRVGFTLFSLSNINAEFNSII